MSYELFFRPEDDAFDATRLFDDLRHRLHYQVSEPQAQYFNEDTGVDFTIEAREAAIRDGALHYPLALTINYCRPSYFIREIEPEVTALVERFRWTASDPQIDGMGEGPYRREGLISGWTSGNEFAVRAMIPPVRESMYSLPTATLMRSWEWNYGSKSLQEQVGEDRYVPLIAFIALDFKAYTAAMWPDAFPTVLPVVDYLIIPRQQLAPRRLLRRVQDMALASWSDALNVLVRYGSGSIEPGGMLTLDYEEPPADVADFVRSLAPTTGEISRLPAEVVLDRELLAKPALEPDEVEWTWIPPPGP